MELNYKVYGEKGDDLIILHGLLGSLDNWQTIAKSLSAHFRVWVLDQRNHGRSPHTSDISYPLLAGDLQAFMQQHEIDKAHILGHSMGGKVAMIFAFLYPDRVEKLIVADIGPVAYQGDHLPLMDAMLSMPLAQIQERSEAEAHLAQTIHSAAIRQFLLKNLGRDLNGFFWKPALQVLRNNYASLMGFDPGNATFQGPVLFMKGSKSGYIRTEDFKYYQSIFPQAEMVVIPDAGHWLHAEQPQLFVEEVNRFLK